MSNQDPKTDRAWQLLGYATRTPGRPDFARLTAEAVRGLPQDRPVSTIFRLAMPLAAAAALVLAVSYSLTRPIAPPVAEDPAVASAQLDQLARMEVALTRLPADADDTDLDPKALRLVDVEDPAKLTDDQLIAILY